MYKISPKMIEEAVNQAIQNLIAKKQEKLLEYRKINKKDNDLSLFPSKNYNIFMGSNEHDPAHIHIRSLTSDHEATFKIDDGSFIDMKYGDENSKETREMKRNFPQWLKLQSLENPAYTNQDMLKMAWVETMKDNLKYQQQNPNNDSIRYQKELQLRQQQQNQAELSKIRPRKRPLQMRKQS